MAANKHEIVIQDTCILFDLVDLNLLKDFFQLDFVVFTTSQIIAEIQTETHKEEIEEYLDNGKLKVDSDGIYEAIISIFDEFAALSFADSSVLELAIRKDAVLFSSDGSLRKISKRKKIIVRGTLWIIEKLYNAIVFLLGKQVASFVFKKYANKEVNFDKDFRYKGIKKDNILYVPIHHPSYILVYKRKQLDNYVTNIRKLCNQKFSNIIYRTASTHSIQRQFH